MKKKLQVFVSSTFTDLKEERQAAVSAILKLGHIPAGMELFTANDKSQWETIKRWIDESDVYMLILGGRYGSIDEDSGMSYTEKEFDYAVSINKPLFSVVIESNSLENKVKIHGTSIIEVDNQSKLKEFRERVLTNMSSFYEDIKDIKLCIMESLPQISSERNLSGWVSGKEVTDVKSLVDEIGTLNAENNELKKQLQTALNKESKATINDTSEFNHYVDIFSKIKFKIPMDNEGKRTEEENLLYLFLDKVSELILGIDDRNINGVREGYIFSKVLPKLTLYGLVDRNIKTTGGTFKHEYISFGLSEKGKSFTIYYEKKYIL